MEAGGHPFAGTFHNFEEVAGMKSCNIISAETAKSVFISYNLLFSVGNDNRPSKHVNTHTRKVSDPYNILWWKVWEYAVPFRSRCTSRLHIAQRSQVLILGLKRNQCTIHHPGNHSQAAVFQEKIQPQQEVLHNHAFCCYPLV